MNIRIPVPKSSGSELFDEECRSHLRIMQDPNNESVARADS